MPDNEIQFITLHALTDALHPPKSAHAVREMKAGEGPDAPIVYFKPNEAIYAQMEAAYGAIYRLWLGNRAPLTQFVVGDTPDKTGVVSHKHNKFTPFNQLSAEDKAYHVKNTPGLAEVLGASYLNGEEDLHGGNFGIMEVPLTNEDGSVVLDDAGGVKTTKRWCKIDHDRSMWFITHQMMGERLMHLGSASQEYQITKRDILAFPKLVDANPHYHPSKDRTFGKQTFSSDDLKLFEGLDKNPKFKTEKWDFFLQTLLVPDAAIHDAVNKNIGEEYKDLREQIINQFLARKQKLMLTLLEIPAFLVYLKKVEKDEDKKTKLSTTVANNLSLDIDQETSDKAKKDAELAARTMLGRIITIGENIHEGRLTKQGSDTTSTEPGISPRDNLEPAAAERPDASSLIPAETAGDNLAPAAAEHQRASSAKLAETAPHSTPRESLAGMIEVIQKYILIDRTKKIEKECRIPVVASPDTIVTEEQQQVIKQLVILGVGSPDERKTAEKIRLQENIFGDFYDAQARLKLLEENFLKLWADGKDEEKPAIRAKINQIVLLNAELKNIQKELEDKLVSMINDKKSDDEIFASDLGRIAKNIGGSFDKGMYDLLLSPDRDQRDASDKKTNIQNLLKVLRTNPSLERKEEAVCAFAYKAESIALDRGVKSKENTDGVTVKQRAANIATRAQYGEIRKVKCPDDELKYKAKSYLLLRDQLRNDTPANTTRRKLAGEEYERSKSVNVRKIGWWLLAGLAVVAVAAVIVLSCGVGGVPFAVAGAAYLAHVAAAGTVAAYGVGAGIALTGAALIAPPAYMAAEATIVERRKNERISGIFSVVGRDPTDKGEEAITPRSDAGQRAIVASALAEESNNQQAQVQQPTGPKMQLTFAEMIDEATRAVNPRKDFTNVIIEVSPDPARNPQITDQQVRYVTDLIMGTEVNDITGEKVTYQNQDGRSMYIDFTNANIDTVLTSDLGQYLFLRKVLHRCLDEAGELLVAGTFDGPRIAAIQAPFVRTMAPSAEPAAVAPPLAFG